MLRVTMSINGTTIQDLRIYNLGHPTNKSKPYHPTDDLRMYAIADGDGNDLGRVHHRRRRGANALVARVLNHLTEGEYDHEQH